MNERTYTIKEASRKANVSTHTLRYWEKVLNGIVVPLRTNGGQRRYTAEHLLLLSEIKRLKRKGLTLEQIRVELSLGPAAEQLEPDLLTVNYLADHIAETVRTTIHKFFREKKHS
ncbi:MAG: MerR family transcriptional regulator [Desulfovermiculus sp.]